MPGAWPPSWRCAPATPASVAAAAAEGGHSSSGSGTVPRAMLLQRAAMQLHSQAAEAQAVPPMAGGGGAAATCQIGSRRSRGQGWDQRQKQSSTGRWRPSRSRQHPTSSTQQQLQLQQLHARMRRLLCSLAGLWWVLQLLLPLQWMGIAAWQRKTQPPSLQHPRNMTQIGRPGWVLPLLSYSCVCRCTCRCCFADCCCHGIVAVELQPPVLSRCAVPVCVCAAEQPSWHVLSGSN